MKQGKVRFFVMVFVLLVSSLAFAQDAKFDITGIWRSQDPGTAQYFQDGDKVTYIYINRGFSHLFTGKYITPTTIKGVQNRHNRANGCKTNMATTITVQSADSVYHEWTAQDSNCDLREGQKGSGKVQRDKGLEASAWY